MKIIVILLFVAISILLILSVGKFLFWNFPLELSTHFQVQYFWLLVIIGIILAIAWWQGQIRNRTILMLLLFTIALNLGGILPWYLERDRVVTDRTDVLRVMTFNIFVKNTDTHKIVKSIQSVNPDLAILVEVEPEMMAQITANLKTEFPYHFRSPGGGLGCLSKFPLQSARGEKFSGSDATNLVTTIEYRHRSIKVIGTHPMVPINVNLFESRNRHLQAIANYVKNDPDPIVLLGDFNITPWSPHYRQFIETSNLHNTRHGFGILPTWVNSTTHTRSRNWLSPIIQIPIDHILIGNNIKVVRTYTGDNANSDHAPIVSDLSIE